MRCIDRACPRQGTADLDDLFGRRRFRRRVIGARGDAQRAGIQRLLHQGAHFGHLCIRCRTAEVAHDGRAQRGVPDHRRNVDGSRRRTQRSHIGGEGGELGLAAVAGGKQTQRHRPRRSRLERGDADAAIAGDDGGHTLRDLADHLRVEQHRAVIMGMGIDEARRDDLAVCIDRPVSRLASEIADRGDAAVANADIGSKSRRLGAVDHDAAADEEIEGRGLLSHDASRQHLLAEVRNSAFADIGRTS